MCSSINLLGQPISMSSRRVGWEVTAHIPNVLYEVPAEFFVGWPGGINRQTLDPYYQKVLDMMEARPPVVDEPTWPLCRHAEEQSSATAYDRLSSHPLGHPAARLEWPKLAIQFGPRPGEERLTDRVKRPYV